MRGRLLEHGLGGAVNFATAFESHARGCELGEAQACHDGDRLARPIASAAATNPRHADALTNSLHGPPGLNFR